jgi:D-lactate dehydrogenase
MRTAVFSTKSYDRIFLEPLAKEFGQDLIFLEPRLVPETAMLAKDSPAVCAFVNDQLSAPVLEQLAAGGTKFIALRSAGYNHVDLEAAARLGLRVARVPAYSPFAVAEHAVGMMLTLNRKYHKSFNRVRDGNFSLEQLLGFDMHGKTVGVVGTGQIGAVAAKIVAGFGCNVLLYDVRENEACRDLGCYVSLDELFRQSDIITLHCPLAPETMHLIDCAAVEKMKPGVMLINTSRGALVDTQAVIAGLKSSKIGYLGLDVYEEEAELFFRDLSDQIIQDDQFTRLLTFPNVLVTAHQAFFTRNAMEQIARVTLANLNCFQRGEQCENEVPTKK